MLGLFAVPGRYYPWMLLVVWQLLMPGVSFLGHLGGVAAGQAYAWGWLRWAMPPSSVFQVSLKALTLTAMHGCCAMHGSLNLLRFLLTLKP